MICKLLNSKRTSDVYTWLKRAKESMTKKSNKKKREGGKQNEITDFSIISVAGVSQRENCCIKRRNWSAIQKCYH